MADQGKEMSGAGQEKATQAGDYTKDKTEQVKEGLQSAAKIAQDKAAAAKDTIATNTQSAHVTQEKNESGSMLQQAGDALKGAMDKTKETLFGANTDTNTKVNTDNTNTKV